LYWRSKFHGVGYEKIKKGERESARDRKRERERESCLGKT